MAAIVPNKAIASTDAIYSDFDSGKVDHGEMQEASIEHVKELMNKEKERVAAGKETKRLDGEVWTANMPAHLLEGYVQESVEETADADEGEDAEEQEDLDNEEAEQ